MPVSGLVIRLSPSSVSTHDALLTALSEVPGVSVGTSESHGVAAVLEADSYEGHDTALTELRDLPGVCAIDVVFHDFSDVERFEGRLMRRHGSER